MKQFKRTKCSTVWRYADIGRGELTIDIRAWSTVTLCPVGVPYYTLTSTQLTMVQTSPVSLVLTVDQPFLRTIGNWDALRVCTLILEIDLSVATGFTAQNIYHVIVRPTIYKAQCSSMVISDRIRDGQATRWTLFRSVYSFRPTE